MRLVIPVQDQDLDALVDLDAPGAAPGVLRVRLPRMHQRVAERVGDDRVGVGVHPKPLNLLEGPHGFFKIRAVLAVCRSGVVTQLVQSVLDAPDGWPVVAEVQVLRWRNVGRYPSVPGGVPGDYDRRTAVQPPPN